MTPTPRSLQVPAFAKVNLGLEVLGLRQDGYHELRTLFQSVDLHDDLRLTLRPRALSLSCDHPAVPEDRSNLALRAALELRRFTGTRQGAHIAITKRIPVAGGLGGGSSDAAAALRGLVRLWGLDLTAGELHALAARLGADVPFFLVGGTALGLARGDEVYPLRHQVRGHLVLVDPARPVSTAAVFRRLDAGLTPRENGHRIFRFVLSQLEGKSAFRALSNDLEDAALEEAPDLRGPVALIRGILVREGALLAALSGSGSTYFGLFDGAGKARRAEAALSAAGFAVHRGRTLGLDQYRKAWSRCLRSGGAGQGRIR
jgi:4-diphosphocytidyl-2-C-methyl-D-erythritol kinase